MAIQQHPLPQDISAYRFRLIGDMTIKQFASLGIGIVVAIIFYSSPLPFFFKYPLAFFFLLLGVGMAFIPVQGRTLDVWILAFIRSIYAPTQFVWKQTATENITADIAAPTSAANLQLAPLVSNARMEISKGVVSSAPTAPVAPLVSITPPATETAPPAVPQSVIPQQSVIDTTLSALSQPTEVSTPETTIPTPPISVSPPAIAPIPEPDAPPIISTSIPPTTNVSPFEAPTPTAISPAPVTPVQSQLPVPYTPTTPNTLVGLTITLDSRILDGVLVEIQKGGLTARATKSNKLGQFMFARPLENGLYQIFAEKEGFTFPPYSLELTGAIIRPLKIQAQK